MSFAEIQEELVDIKRELDRLEKGGARKNEVGPLRNRIAAIEPHPGLDKKTAA
jgi:hypothetical protein